MTHDQLADMLQTRVGGRERSEDSLNETEEQISQRQNSTTGITLAYSLWGTRVSRKQPRNARGRRGAAETRPCSFSEEVVDQLLKEARDSQRKEQSLCERLNVAGNNEPNKRANRASTAECAT